MKNQSYYCITFTNTGPSSVAVNVSSAILAIRKGMNSHATCHFDYWCGLLERAVNKRSSHTALRSGDKTA